MSATAFARYVGHAVEYWTPTGWRSGRGINVYFGPRFSLCVWTGAAYLYITDPDNVRFPVERAS